MKLRITVHGVAYEVDVEVLDAGEGLPRIELPTAVTNTDSGQLTSRPSFSKPVTSPDKASSTAASPIAGTIIAVNCKIGDRVRSGQELIIIEAMKMETSVASPTDGIIKSINVAAGDAVREGETLVAFE